MESPAPLPWRGVGHIWHRPLHIIPEGTRLLCRYSRNHPLRTGLRVLHLAVLMRSGRSEFCPPTAHRLSCYGGCIGFLECTYNRNSCCPVRQPGVCFVCPRDVWCPPPTDRENECAALFGHTLALIGIHKGDGAVWERRVLHAQRKPLRGRAPVWKWH